MKSHLVRRINKFNFTVIKNTVEQLGYSWPRGSTNVRKILGNGMPRHALEKIAAILEQLK